MDWYGNEDDEEALQRGFQGEGGAGGDQGNLTLAELAAKAVSESEVEKLSKIGQLVVKRIF